jgi:hypothetical protein
MTFIFEPEDFFAVFEEEEESDEGDSEGNSFEVGYQTTCSKAKETMDRFGYTLPFFADVYGQFQADLQDTVSEQLVQTIMEGNKSLRKTDIEEQVFGYFQESRPIDHLVQFISVLRKLITTKFDSPPFDRPYSFGRIRSKLPPDMQEGMSAAEYLNCKNIDGARLIDFDRLESYVEDHYTAFPPGILVVTLFLSLLDYPEITDLLFARCALEAGDPDAIVQLDVTELVQSVEEARSLHSEQASSLVEKVKLYNRVYERLFANESTVREQHIRSRCSELLQACKSEESTHKKGRLLEELMEVIFTADRSSEVVHKRVSTGDEEIDLVIKNDIDKPFWLAFSSPAFFVECKNWSGVVGSKELRDFETKIRNHARFTKLGFFVSINGFSVEVAEELKRAGREDYHITLLDGRDLEELTGSDCGVFSWLEKRIMKIH